MHDYKYSELVEDYDWQPHVKKIRAIKSQLVRELGISFFENMLKTEAVAAAPAQIAMMAARNTLMLVNARHAEGQVRWTPSFGQV